jgi:hypothetical protein
MVIAKGGLILYELAKPKPNFRFDFQRHEMGGLIGLLALMMGLRLYSASLTGLAPDEAYYWLWAQHPALGYYDHPPMVAWLIMASTQLIGDSLLGVRLMFVGMTLILSLIVYDLARTLFTDKTIARRAVLWVNVSVLLSAGGMLATPDGPSVFFYSLACLALAKVWAGKTPYWWLIVGLMAGLGLQSKYTNFFFGLGVMTWFIFDRQARQHLLTPWPWLGGLLAFLVIAPNLVWNAHNDWASLDKQFSRLAGSGLNFTYLIEAVLFQALLLNPFVVAFLIKAWGDALKFATCPPFNHIHLRPFTFLNALSLPMLLYMVIHALHDPVQGNWPAPVYPLVIMMAAATSVSFASPLWRGMRLGVVILGFSLCTFLLLYVSQAKGLRSQKSDPVDLMRFWPEFAEEIDQIRIKTDSMAIFTTRYELMGPLSYQLRAKSSLWAIAEKDRYPWQTPALEQALVGRKVLIVEPAKQLVQLSNCFYDLNRLGAVQRLDQQDQVQNQGRSRKKSEVILYTGRLARAGCRLD